MADDELATRRKRLKYRSARRGTRELDLFLGAFAEARIDGLTPEQLDRYEDILGANENEIYDWLSGRTEIPPEHRNDVMTLLLTFKFRPATT